MYKIHQILSDYDIPLDAKVYPIGSGLINHTWEIVHQGKKYILQRINQNVFKTPEDIAGNIRLIGNYLSIHYPQYLFIKPILTKDGHDLVILPDDGYYRMFPFLENSFTIDVALSPDEAYQAAQQFAKFTRVLNDFPVEKLKLTIPDFHNLPLRYRQFEASLTKGNIHRIKESKDAIDYLQSNHSIVSTFEEICHHPHFKVRVMHLDTKISNVLFDHHHHGLCVIDLDTTMPGYFISDVGDMIRTYVSPVSEEEMDLSKIQIRTEFFKAIVTGYLHEMNEILSDDEKDHFVYAGKFMIYMQALRFLTDYLNEDIYYESKYPGHNFHRAMNQITLLQRLIEKEADLQSLIPKEVILS